MAAITSAAAGFWDVGATWTGGVKPGNSDTVTLNHKVTIRTTETFGTDPSGSSTQGTFAGSVVLTINSGGELYASRIANSILNIRGAINNNGGTLNYGTDTNCASPFNTNDPIPDGITATIRFTTAGNNILTGKYGYYDNSANGANTFIKGLGRTINTKLNGAHSVGAGSITVDDATNWKVADRIGVHTSDATSSHIETFAIRSIAGNVVTLGTIANYTVADTLDFAHVDDTPVSNFTSNVTVGFSSTNYCYFTARVTGSTGARKVQVKNANFEYVNAPNGLYGNPSYSGVGLIVTGTPTVQYDYYQDSTIVFGNGGFQKFQGGSYISVWDRLAVFHSDANGCWFGSSQGIVTYNNCVGFSPNGSGRLSSITYGTPGYATHNDGYYVTGRQYQYDQCIANYFNRCTFGGISRPIHSNKATNKFVECNFGTFGTTGVATALTDIVESTVSVQELTNCQFVSGITIQNQMQTAGAMAPESFLRIANYNADVTLHEKHIKTGKISRDNSQLIRSRSSIKFDPLSANTAHGEIYTVPASAGIPITFRFGLRYNTNYGTPNPPSVTVSGLGITPSVFTAGGSANTDYQGTVTVTPVTTGSLIITVVGQSANTTGSYWFSGMTVAPWIDWSQHYGYTFNPTSAQVVVDSVVQVSEATAVAYSGISFGSNTLTITGTRSIREIYDWLKQYEASNRLDPIITSTDGLNFTMNASLVVNAGQITGTTEILTLSATRTWSFVSGGTTLIRVISPVSGTIATVAITITCKDENGNNIENARVYIEAGAGGATSQGTVLLNALTNASGVATANYVHTQNQPLQNAKARKSTSAPYYKESSISGTITLSGFSATLIMVGDD